MDEYEAIQSQAPIFKSLSGIAQIMALKCVVDLHLADILHSHENPITLSQLASSTDSPTPLDIFVLKRVMRTLVRDKIFTSHEPSDVSTGETRYGSTKASSWLLEESEMSLFPFVGITVQPSMITLWCHLTDCVKENGSGFKKVHGCEFASRNPGFNKEFNHAISAHSKMLMKSLVEKYREGFENAMGSLVDIGGGIGEAIVMIVKEFPC